MTTERKEFDEIVTDVLAENTAQSVLNHLKELESNRAHVLTRWVWELLQNARDALANSDTELVASIEQSEDEVVFRHNGSNFKLEEIAHLIYHGSTKVESEESIGQYGSGFLTTHLLSPEINVAGQVEGGRRFDFRLRREVASVSELSESMKKAVDDFQTSLSSAPATDDFTTTFRYPLRGDAIDVVEEGIATLKQCAPFVVAFNREFSEISIKSPDGTVGFNVVERAPLKQDGLEQVTVSETENGNQKVRQYILAHGNGVSIAIPMESSAEGHACLPVGDIPKLFLGFPLVGTENFSFPAVINSFRFAPTENRDGVYLWQGSNQANTENEAIIEEACKLLVGLLQFAASSGWHNAYLLAEIPDIQGQSWLNSEQLRERLKEMLIEVIRQTPAVINEFGEAVPPKESELPIADTAEGVVRLWNLLVGWEKNQDIWPRRDEAAGWCNAAISWAKLSNYETSPFNEVIDGRRLASIVHEVSHVPSSDPRTHRLSRLTLKEGVSAINWLDQLIGFCIDNELGRVIHEYRVVPSQAGFLRTLPNLHRDQQISEELKDVAGLLGWRIRIELRDTRLDSLAEEVGQGDWDNDYVLGELIKRLRDRAEKNPDTAFTEASVRIFTWLVESKSWDLLQDFPVFARRVQTDQPLNLIYLSRNDQANNRPLAPVKAWEKDLRTFMDLFPPNRILSDAFFEALPDINTWQMIDEQSLVGLKIGISDMVNFNKFYPDHPLREGVEHRTAERVPITDIWRRAEIMERVRDSQTRARLFWRFLTEWLSPKDLDSLEITQAKCECGEEHRYYPAAWIEPLRESAWVRQSNDARTYANAQSLANLLRDSDAQNPNALSEGSAAAKLLEAIGVARLALIRELVAKDDESRAAMDNVFINMLTTTDGNIDRLSQAHQYLKDLETDPNLAQVVAKRLEQVQRTRENQSLGYKVEELVKQSLEGEGFTVQRTGVGSDFKIEYDDVTSLKLTRSGQTWLVEVKATRDNRVRMTDIQAGTAAEKGDGFLLCVVPVEGETSALELDDVRNNMRFVANIGPRVAPLCSNLEKFRVLREDITTDESSGVQLEVESGAIRVRVANSVWHDEGFPLAELPNRLK